MKYQAAFGTLLILSACYSGNQKTATPDASAPLDASASSDASAQDGAATTADASIYDTPTVCTSGSHWTRGNHGSSQMHPGGACIDCHSGEREAPTFSIAGTVYPTAHEPDDCNGLSNVQVVVTDANDRTYTLTSNNAGNFYTERSIAFPYRVKLVRNGIEREMADEQNSGDCNSCHTEGGFNDAPGRVMAP